LAHFERLSVNVATRLAEIDSVDHRYRSFYRCKLTCWMKDLHELGGLMSKYENRTRICPVIHEPPGLAQRRRQHEFITLERDFSVAAGGAESGKSLWLPKYGDHVTRMHEHILGWIGGDTRKWNRRHYAVSCERYKSFIGGRAQSAGQGNHFENSAALGRQRNNPALRNITGHCCGICDVLGNLHDRLGLAPLAL